MTIPVLTRFTAGSRFGGVVPITGADTVVAAHAGKLLVLNPTALMKLSLTAAATLGPDFAVMVRNDAPFTVTIDPAGTETIDGLQTIPLFKGQECTLFGDGTAWRTFGLKKEWTIATATIASGVLQFTLPLDIPEFEATGAGLYASAAAQFFTRFGISTPDATATAYQSEIQIANGTSTSAGQTPPGSFLAYVAPDLYSSEAGMNNFAFSFRPGSTTVPLRGRWNSGGYSSGAGTEQVLSGAGFWNPTTPGRAGLVQFGAVGADLAGFFTLKGRTA